MRCVNSVFIVMRVRSGLELQSIKPSRPSTAKRIRLASGPKTCRSGLCDRDKSLDSEGFDQQFASFELKSSNLMAVHPAESLRVGEAWQIQLPRTVQLSNLLKNHT